MAARRNQKQPSVQRNKTAKDISAKDAAGEPEARAEKQALIEEHLPPLGLTFLILLCSGFLLVFALRDFLSTGKNVGGSPDEAMLVGKIISREERLGGRSRWKKVGSRSHVSLHFPFTRYLPNPQTGLMMPRDGSRHREVLVRSSR